MATYLGRTIITMPDSPSAASIEFARGAVVGSAVSPFTRQRQVQDWGGRWMEASLQLPPMSADQAAPWVQFVMDCNGIASVFQLPAFLAARVPTGGCPAGYWSLKENVQKFSISQAMIYGIHLEIEEAL